MSTAQQKMDAKAAIKQAEDEIAAEDLKRGVAALKVKLIERNQTAVVLANIDREIEDLKLQIETGNL